MISMMVLCRTPPRYCPTLIQINKRLFKYNGRRFEECVVRRQEQKTTAHRQSSISYKRQTVVRTTDLSDTFNNIELINI